VYDFPRVYPAHLYASVDGISTFFSISQVDNRKLGLYLLPPKEAPRLSLGNSAILYRSGLGAAIEFIMIGLDPIPKLVDVPVDLEAMWYLKSVELSKRRGTCFSSTGIWGLLKIWTSS
jgi:hypothetical protein